jgi:hypothetical protein
MPKIHMSCLWGPYSYSVRHYHDVHIFLDFEKYQIFAQNTKRVSLQCYKKMFVRDENWPEIHISWLWGSSYAPVRHYGIVHKLFEVFKKSIFGSKPKGVSIGFTEKHKFTIKTDHKSIFNGRDDHLLPQIDVMWCI